MKKKKKKKKKMKKQKLTEIKKLTAANMFPDLSIWIRRRSLLKSVNSRSSIQLQLQSNFF